MYKGRDGISCVIMSCKELTAKEKSAIKQCVALLNKAPRLAVIVVGDNMASQSYVRGKRRDCEECGIECEILHFNEAIETSDICDIIQRLNFRDDVDGILVQLPLPEHIDKSAVIEQIDPCKDVDGFCSENMGKLFINSPMFVPCTPLGIMDMLNHFNIDIDGKRCAVIGRSDIVGKPISLLLTNAGGTVTLCHSHTNDLADITRQADIIVCAVGRSGFLTEDMVKDGAVVVDVGINRDEDGGLCGDVDFDSVSQKCSAITPVPGGVGLMTRVSLLKNTLSVYLLNKNGR